MMLLVDTYVIYNKTELMIVVKNTVVNVARVPCIFYDIEAACLRKVLNVFKVFILHNHV